MLSWPEVLLPPAPGIKEENLPQGGGGFKLSYSVMGKEVSDHLRAAGF